MTAKEYLSQLRRLGYLIDHEILEYSELMKMAEDIANVELRPTFVSLVDNSAQGEEVLRNLQRHKVNTDYIRAVPSGMGMWLAVFDQTGDLAGSISQRPDLSTIETILDERGDEIFQNADSVVIEAVVGKGIVKRVLDYALAS